MGGISSRLGGHGPPVPPPPVATALFIQHSSLAQCQESGADLGGDGEMYPPNHYPKHNMHMNTIKLIN